jgi:hypothetical protein
MRSVAEHPVVGVGVVDSCGLHLLELLTRPWDGVRKVDDVEDLRSSEAGDLHGSHTPEAMASARLRWVEGCEANGC